VAITPPLRGVDPPRAPGPSAGGVPSAKRYNHATLAGLTLPYSNGPTEGVNTKIKLLKRQTYGKANFALLRKRILLT
jgi:transposase